MKGIPFVELGLAGVVWASLPIVRSRWPRSNTSSRTRSCATGPTIFISVTLQALPFLVLGVVLSASISALVPPSWIARAVPKNAAVAVPTAGIAGALLPGRECSSVPVASRLVSRGVPVGAGLTFLLAAPAINPIVMVSTAVAFPGRPEMVLGRFVASLLTAVWSATLDCLPATGVDGEPATSTMTTGPPSDNFVSTATARFPPGGRLPGCGGGDGGLTAYPGTPVGVRAGRWLRGDRHPDYGRPWPPAFGRPEADAFVAAGLTQFSLTARLVFLVVGPMVDLKLIALQIGSFGRGFAFRFAPLTLVTAIVFGTIVGGLLT